MRAIDRVTYLALAPVVLLSLGLFQVQAASPTPDGGYPNFAAAELLSNTTGNSNSSVGGGALTPNNADSTYNFNNSKFHGWWRNTMIGAMNGFDAGGPYSALRISTFTLIPRAILSKSSLLTAQIDFPGCNPVCLILVQFSFLLCAVYLPLILISIKVPTNW